MINFIHEIVQKNGYMRHPHTRYIIYFIAALALMTCCTGKDKGSFPIGKGKGIGFHSKKADTIYTQQAAMNIYAYQPERALRSELQHDTL